MILGSLVVALCSNVALAADTDKKLVLNCGGLTQPSFSQSTLQFTYNSERDMTRANSLTFQKHDGNHAVEMYSKCYVVWSDPTREVLPVPVSMNCYDAKENRGIQVTKTKRQENSLNLALRQYSYDSNSGEKTLQENFGYCQEVTAE